VLEELFKHRTAPVLGKNAILTCWKYTIKKVREGEGVGEGYLSIKKSLQI
jgi:hypothetical protein